MKRRGKIGSFAFTADRFGQPRQAKITNEALAQFSNSKMPRLSPREVRRIYIDHREEIDRIARIICQERKDPADKLTITGSDIQRLKRSRR
jgi:hypothetical protein